MAIFIYTLIDPATGAIRYVGKSADPIKRLAVHIARARSGCETHCRRWIAKCLASGVVPLIDVVDCADDHRAANEAERRWIMDLKAAGVQLTNLTIGGDGRARGSRLRQETRDRMSAARRGKPLTQKAVEAGRLAKLGKSRPRSALEPMWNANRGRKQSPAEIAKRIAKTKGRVLRPAGWKHSTESKARIGAASKARRSAAIALSARWGK